MGQLPWKDQARRQFSSSYEITLRYVCALRAVDGDHVSDGLYHHPLTTNNNDRGDVLCWSMPVLAGLAFNYLITLLVQSIAKYQRPDGGQYAESHGDGLSQPDGPWN